MGSGNTVLIYRLGSLGDTVVALPCFHLVARSFPDRRRILLTNVPVHSKALPAPLILGESSLVHGYMSYSVGTRNFFAFAKLCSKIRQLKVDTVVYLTAPRGESAVRRDECFFRFCGVKRLIGLPLGELATHRYDPATDAYEAESSRLARCLAQLGDAAVDDPASWDLLLTAREKACATRVLHPLGGEAFLALGIASKVDVTDWGLENWKALMPKLHREFPEHALVFVGAEEDRAAADSVTALWAGRSLNLSGALSPRESAAVLRQSDLFLGPDSGPMHLAASVGTPCVSIFSARNRPGVWFPFGAAHQVIYHKTECFGCGLAVCSTEKKRCILSISVDEVVAAARRAADKRRESVLTQRLEAQAECR